MAMAGRRLAGASGSLPDLAHGGPVPGGVERLLAAEVAGSFRCAVTMTRPMVARCHGCQRRKWLPPAPGVSVP
jgi:hypothetical protein